MQTRAFPGILLGAAIALTTACASTGVSPKPFPMPNHGPARPSPDAPAPAPAPGSPPATPSEAPDAYAGDGFTIAGAAMRLRGTPYRSGGTDPRGFDCSGFVRYVYGLYGITLPRLVHEQYGAGEKIRLEDLEPGDLVFFVTEGRHVSHVGIAIGGDRFVHAPNSRGVVRVDSLATGYWGEHVAGARRVEPGPG